nr:hypothetical protein [Tanacetum cinerariifolium]
MFSHHLSMDIENGSTKVKALVVEAHIVELNDLIPQLLDNDSTLSEEPSESSEIASLTSSPFKNEEKVFNPGIHILRRSQILNDESNDKDLKDKDLTLDDRDFLSISSDQELLLFLELTVIETLLSFSSENKDKDCPGSGRLSCSWFCPSFTRASILSMLIYENSIS